MSNVQTAPTLEDVAQLAGVSTATVSRCLNSPDRVVAATRERVESAIETLGYTPNFAARVMAAKRTFTIGAIIPTMDNAIFARGVQAFQEALHEKGYTLLISSSAFKPEVEKEQIRTLIARGADGLLLIGHDRNPEIYAYLDQQKVPALVAWSFIPDAALPSVGFDNRAAMRDLANEVIGLGHTRIAMISGFTKGNDRALLRCEGLRDAHAAHGFPRSSLEIIEVPYSIEDGAAAFRTLMAHPTRPSVVMCGNDVLAAGAISAAERLGIRVPHDVSVTGFDDLELARILRPTLTTVHVPHREMGRRAAESLITMVESKTRSESIRLDTDIRLRDSLGPYQSAVQG